MKRCLAKVASVFELWVAAAVLANNLMKIAALLRTESCADEKRLTLPILRSWKETAAGHYDHVPSNGEFVKS